VLCRALDAPRFDRQQSSRAAPFSEGWAAKDFAYFNAELAYLLRKSYEQIMVNGLDYLVPPMTQ
jgi:hypothetical protein